MSVSNDRGEPPRRWGALWIIRDALFAILTTAKDLHEARQMAGEALCDLHD
jgi:hypothetical protein